MSPLDSALAGMMNLWEYDPGYEKLQSLWLIQHRNAIRDRTASGSTLQRVHACLPGCGSRCRVHSQHVLRLRQRRAKPLLCRHRPRSGDKPGRVLAALQGCLCETTIPSCICSMWVVATVRLLRRAQALGFVAAGVEISAATRLVGEGPISVRSVPAVSCRTEASRIELRRRDDVRFD